MQRTVIAIADATRARLFAFDRSDEVGGMHETLSELTDFVNPARRLTPAQLFSRMLGTLRTTGLRCGGIVVDELARDYVKMTQSEIHDELVDHGLLPPSPPRPVLSQTEAP